VDKARSTVGRVSPNGLLEINRQRIQQALQLRTHRPCPTCNGVGRLASEEMVCLSLLRRVEARAATGSIQGARIGLHPELADALQNHYRRELADLESEFDIEIEVIATAGLHRPDEKIEWQKREKPVAPPKPKQAAITFQAWDLASLEDDEDEEDEDDEDFVEGEEHDDKGQAASGEAGEAGEAGNAAKRRRRRRGGRKRKGKKGAPGENGGGNGGNGGHELAASKAGAPGGETFLPLVFEGPEFVEAPADPFDEDDDEEDDDFEDGEGPELEAGAEGEAAGNGETAAPGKRRRRRRRRRK
jgi:ribonuclease E